MCAVSDIVGINCVTGLQHEKQVSWKYLFFFFFAELASNCNLLISAPE
jgi:hypothetical protein